MTLPKVEDIVIGLIILALVSLLVHKHWAKKPQDLYGTEGLGVKDLIHRVRTELIDSEKLRIESGQPPLFEVKGFDLEINFVVKSRSKEQGQIEYEVVTIGGETEVSSEKVQKITLHMMAGQPVKGKEMAEPGKINSDSVVTHGDTPPQRTETLPPTKQE